MPQMSRSYGIGRGAGGRQWMTKEGMLIFEATEHQVKDCQKMKLAKTK